MNTPAEQQASTHHDARPIDSCQQQLVIARTRDCLIKGATFYRCELPPIQVLFDLSGLAAGQFRWSAKPRQCVIRYNPWVFAADFDHHLTDTVAHEVAHYIAHQLHGAKTRPHGPAWKHAMIALGVTPKATGRYSLNGVPVRRQRRYAYRCACRIHQISRTLHNRHQKGRRYVCKKCSSPLMRSDVTCD